MHVTEAPNGANYVSETAEIVRVRGLPWRDWSAYTAIPELRTRLTTWLQHTPSKCDPRCFCCRHVDTLNEPQAVYLSELYGLHRAIVPFRTGAGKTLAALLTPTVLSKALGRPMTALLMVPASGREKTIYEARAYSRHWRCAAFRLVTYEFLANPRNAKWLDENPHDVVLADEAHRLTPRSKAWGRLGRHLMARAKAGAPAIFVPFTASLTSRKLEECWHYCRSAMGDAGPFPATRNEAQVWAAATDEKVPADSRLLPGALGTLAPLPDGDMSPHRRAQKQLGDRIGATPGIVSTKEDIPPITLLLSTHHLPLPDHVRDMERDLRDHWRLPSGEEFSHAWDVWKNSRRFGCGLYYRWDPPAPKEWLARRSEWTRFAREYMKYRQNIDSDVHVANMIDRGELDDSGILAAWREIRPTFTPVSVAEWIDDTTLKYAANWLREHDRGICWVEHRPLGLRLAELTGFPYFSVNASDARTGTSIVGYEGTPAIISLAHHTQFNLQYYKDNLITSCPPMGRTLDQLIGRTLRENQEANEVTCEFMLTTAETHACLSQCFADAKRAQNLDGQPKKLLYGDCMDTTVQEMRENA